MKNINPFVAANREVAATNQTFNLKRILGKLAFAMIATFFFSNTSLAQPVNPAANPDYVMPGGPYQNVQNTAAYQAYCTSCPGQFAHAYAWDGDQPHIATYVMGTPPELAALPTGASDPDIVYGLQGTRGIVVYEYFGDIVYQTFTNVIGGGSLALNPTVNLLHAGGTHPNIDKPKDCVFDDLPNAVVAVYRDFSGSSDIEFRTGSLTGGFGTATPVPAQASNAPVNTRTYSDRINPDVTWSGTQSTPTLQFTAVGFDIFSGNTAVDFFEFLNPSLSPPLNQGIVSGTGREVHPRIAGLVPSNYFITYGEASDVFHGYSGVNFTVISPAGVNELPAIAMSGDYHDVIWSTDYVTGNLDIMGLGFAGTTPDPFFKEANDGTTSGTIRKFFPSISGHCGGLEYYAMCWWGEDENIYYKESFANGSPQYKKEPSSNMVQLIPDLIDSETPHQQSYTTETTVNIVLYNMLGQPVLRTEARNFVVEAANLSPGMYVAELHEVETGKRETKKVMVK